MGTNTNDEAPIQDVVADFDNTTDTTHAIEVNDTVGKVKNYFYRGFYAIIDRDLQIEHQIPMSGVFETDIEASPISAYRALEDSWETFIIDRYNEANNPEVPLTKNNVMVVIDTLQIIT